MSDKIDILIVEDSLTQALKLELVLRRNGYRVASAINGREGLEIIKAQLPRLVISDIIMPEMDGHELCRNIRRDEALKEIPVILLTSLSEPDDVIKALECGADNFVTKPYDEEFLIARVRNILLNHELRKKGGSNIGLEIYFRNKRHFITSDRLQIIDLLFSTYENAIQKNQELIRVNQELSKTKQALEQRNIELEELSEQKSHFLGMAAHDLRNPLGVISNFSTILLDDAGDRLTEEHLELVSLIRSSSEFMFDVVNEFLDLSQIESGKLGLDLQAIDLVDLVRQCVRLNRVFAEKKKTEIVLSCGEELPPMMMDASKIQQVLNNLISNAVKYSHPESTVELNLARQGDSVELFVRDQGQGIPKGEIGNLFVPFEKTSVKATAGEKSTGLGLVITKKIVEGHGGNIWVESEVGSGSTFHVSLPVILPPKETVVSALSRHAESEGENSDPTPAEIEAGDYHILVADDNAVNQKLILRLLQKRGYSVAVVENGRQAVDAFGKGAFDLILMDIHMPETDGLEATSMIRMLEDSRETRIPIIALTGTGTAKDRQRCRDAGMDDMMLKPFKAQQLYAMLQRMLRHPTTRQTQPGGDKGRREIA